MKHGTANPRILASSDGFAGTLSFFRGSPGYGFPADGWRCSTEGIHHDHPSTWNLTLPVGNPATVIQTNRLKSGYQDEYFASSGDKIVFWAPVSGQTTTNSSYPRAELRETLPDGTLNNWTYKEADNYLRASLMIGQVPSTGKVVIGQIHQYQVDRPLLKLQYRYSDKTATGQLEVLFRKKPDDTDAQIITVATNVPLNKRFTYTVHLTAKGSLVVNVADAKWNQTLDPGWAAQKLYLKAGAYTQDNDGSKTEGSKVTFYSLSAEHRKT